MDRGGYTAVGRALTKHNRGGRALSVYAPIRGNVAQKNEEAHQILGDILRDTGAWLEDHGEVFDIRHADGRGVRVYRSGRFKCLLEPPSR